MMHEHVGDAGRRVGSSDELGLLLRGESRHPAAHLGPHLALQGGRPAVIVRAFLPAAREAAIRLLSDGQDSGLVAMDRIHPAGLFATLLAMEPAGDGKTAAMLSPTAYVIVWHDEAGMAHEEHDPYAFPPRISDMDLYLFGEGTHQHLWEMLGAHVCRREGVWGTHFAVWAPNARAISVIGDHNNWDSRRHPLEFRGGPGVWELFIPDLGPGALYKYAIRTPDGHEVHKADPFAYTAEVRPLSASVVADLSTYTWSDDAWTAARPRRQAPDQPITIYEVHLGSWRRVPEEGDRMLTYRELADQLIPYVLRMGYTHIELLPVTEHPFDQSWGYQTTGYYAPTSRFGPPQDFMYFVDRCHQTGLGVLLDWVPAHFAMEGHGLGIFDGTHLFEHADARQGQHIPWGTYVFNYGRNEVRNFLIGSALYWMEIYHIDGLRVDAVAAMLYLDYGRPPGAWMPNAYGGRENLDAIDFLQRLNTLVHERHPGILTCAEESTTWPNVTRPASEGGLGFDMKWNMGWMHDMLAYVEYEPIHRRYHQGTLTFSFHYAFSEHYLLPLSHDEVVHLKKSLLSKMPGDTWQQFANLRLLLGYMNAHPGKKLLFMGGEFGQWTEWAYQRSLDWHVLQKNEHQRLQDWARAVNTLYTTEAALYELDFSALGFAWIDGSDDLHSVVAFLRYAGDRRNFLVVVANFTPAVRRDYRIGVPEPGHYVEVINSDAVAFGGSGVLNMPLHATDVPSMGHPHSLLLTLPPLAIVILRRGTEG